MSTVAPHDAKAGYEAFGSFHTASIDALFAGKAFDLAPPHERFPALPLEPLVTPTPIASSSTSSDSTSLSPRSNRAHFRIDFTNWTYLNHGAFGSTTRFATDVAAAWRAHADAQPLRFYDRELFPYLVQSIAALAAFLHVRNARDLVLLPNATAGLHAVLHSVLTASSSTTQVERVVVCFSTRYGAVRKMLQAIADDNSTTTTRVVELPLSLAESMDDVLVTNRLDAALSSLDNVTLVVIDHIPSNTGVVLPVAALTQRCHAHNVPILIDGAHALLNLPLDVDAIGADYYVGNCHKWFCAPRGAGFLHVSSNSLSPSRIQPRVVSHGYFDSFQSAFMWRGLDDYSPWLALPQCVAYWEHVDVAKCRLYMHTLVQLATEALYTMWNMPDAIAAAQSFPIAQRHAMRLVQLPPGWVFGVPTCSSKGKVTSADAKHIQDTLHAAFGIEVPVKCVDDAALYVRLSAHVYNTLEDFERLGAVVLEAYEP